MRCISRLRWRRFIQRKGTMAPTAPNTMANTELPTSVPKTIPDTTVTMHS